MGMPIPSMFSGFRVCRRDHAIPTTVAARVVLPVVLLGVGAAPTTKVAAELFASVTPCNAPGDKDARRRLARRAFLWTFHILAATLPKTGKIVTFAVATVFCTL